MKVKKILVTGGAGFIGSSLVERLLREGAEVVVLDHFRAGKEKNLEGAEELGPLKIVKGDMLDSELVRELMKKTDAVFHLAANPDVRILTNTKDYLDQNIVATFNVLEAMRRGGKKFLFFTSTSAVYGEANIVPTTEDYGPAAPISLYAASKLGSEALISAYSHTFDLNCVVFRLANIIGRKSGHGVIFDFIKKLEQDKTRLEILGDGTQSKSYLSVEDCIDAMIRAVKKFEKGFEIYNIGSDDTVNVKRIGEIIRKEMGLKNAELVLTGGPEGRGWKGDVKTFLLSNEKIKKLGWTPKHNSEEAVRKTVREILGKE